MMEIRILCVGRLKEPFYEAAVQEYSKRLKSLCNLSVDELPEERLPDHPTDAQVEAALKREGERIKKTLSPGSTVIALCVEGQQMSSLQLADQLRTWILHGQSKLIWVIGGSFGLHPDIKSTAQLRLSMSSLTFPHHLARVILLEQLYRSFQIIGGGSYHK